MVQYNREWRFGHEGLDGVGGEGSYSVEFSHYEVVPSNVQKQIVEKIKKAAAENS